MITIALFLSPGTKRMLNLEFRILGEKWTNHKESTKAFVAMILLPAVCQGRVQVSSRNMPDSCCIVYRVGSSQVVSPLEHMYRSPYNTSALHVFIGRTSDCAGISLICLGQPHIPKSITRCPSKYLPILDSCRCILKILLWLYHCQAPTGQSSQQYVMAWDLGWIHTSCKLTVYMHMLFGSECCMFVWRTEIMTCKI